MCARLLSTAHIRVWFAVISSRRGSGPCPALLPDKAALSPAETSGEQKQERIREDGSTNMALSGFGSRFYSLGLSGNIWLAGRISILPRLIGRAVNVSIFTSPAILCHEFISYLRPRPHVRTSAGFFCPPLTTVWLLFFSAGKERGRRTKTVDPYRSELICSLRYHFMCFLWQPNELLIPPVLGVSAILSD